jgi:5,10-methylene-tetrahydrofolate dehydrogenase/methenyl tetrahydrofolate cyclohydrolase
MILSGKPYARKIYKDLKNQVESLTKKPKLCVVLV